MELSPKTIERLDSMIGGVYLYMGRSVKILGYGDTDEKVRIKTSTTPIIIKKVDVIKELDEFMVTDEPVDEDDTVDKGAMVYFKNDPSSMNALEKILMDNIEKLQTDSTFIPQAKAINDNVGSILKISQQKIDIFREMRKGGGKR